MNLYGFLTLFHKEVLRFRKVALQTLIAPMVTALLYLMVFAHVLEGRVQVYHGIAYSAFLIPGLIMMSIIQNAFANSSSSLIQSKVTGNLVFVLLSPLSALEFFLAFMLAATLRGVLVAVGMYLVAVIFIPLPVHHPFILLAFALLSSAVLGTLGIIAGIWAEKFDHIAGFQNFFIMPMSFLSGVFYSIHSLSPFWRELSHFNPFFYMIDGFRYGFLGTSDVNPAISLAIVLGAFVALAGLTLYWIKTGYRLRD
ncbi:MAG TPA: ABC transporter permease [Gammaproteobacteria bacterium]|nr:ABC transporter permease [Gammaproteobacteria bacterium]